MATLLFVGHFAIPAVLAIVVAVAARRPVGRAFAAAAILPLLDAAALCIYVFGEDDYRGNGISRWDAYRSPGGELGELFVVTVTLMAAVSIALAYTALMRMQRLFVAAAVVGAFVSLVLGLATFIGFTAN